MPPKKNITKGGTKRKKKSAKDAGKMNELNPLRVEYENEPPSMTADRMLNNGDFIWARHYQGVKIQQLFNDFYNPVIDLLLQSTLSDDPLCRVFKMDTNFRAMEEMLFKARDWLSQSLSLVAVDEETGQVYGAVIGRIVNSDELLNEMEQLKEIEIKQKKEKEELKLAAVSKKELRSTSRKSFPRKSKKSAKTSKNKKESRKKQTKELRKQNRDALRSELTRASIRTRKGINQVRTYPKLDPPVDVIPIEEKSIVQPCVFDDSYKGYSDEILTNFLHFRYCLFSVIDLFFEFRCYYKIYAWVVNKEHQNQGIGKALLGAAEEMCQKLQIPAIVSLFTSVSSQHIAEKLHYSLIAMLTYEAWSNIRIENELYACLMIKYLDVPQIASYIKKSKPQDNKEISRTEAAGKVRNRTAKGKSAAKKEKKTKKKKK